MKIYDDKGFRSTRRRIDLGVRDDRKRVSERCARARVAAAGKPRAGGSSAAHDGSDGSDDRRDGGRIFKKKLK